MKKVLKPALKMPCWVVLGASAVLIPLSAHAASGNRPALLPWGREGEVLEYHSCGMGDACWIAEIKNAHGKVKAKLRCDSKSLYASVTPSAPASAAPAGASSWPTEQLHAKNCNSVNDSTDRPAAIRKALEKLLQRSDGKGK